MLLPVLLALVSADFRSFEGDTITVEARSVPGSSTESVVVVGGRGGFASLIAVDERAELSLAGRRFQLDGAYLRQFVDGRFVDLRRVGEFDGEIGWEDTLDDGDDGPMFSPPILEDPDTNGPGVQPHVPGAFPKPPEDHDDDWTTMTKEEWHWNFPGEEIPPRKTWKRVGRGTPRGGGSCGDCGAPPPGTLGVGDDGMDDESGPFCVVCGSC